MRIFLTILLLCSMTCKAQNILFIITGESNSGGIAENADAFGYELAERDTLPILNNFTLLFEPLHIGVNNLLGHAGLEAYWYDSHGLENGMADRISLGAFELPCYLVKTGQGGSTISQWASGDPYMDTLTKRADAAIALVSSPHIYIFYSQGINDMIAFTSVATWKAATKAHIDTLRSYYGSTIPVLMTKFEGVAGMETYNAAIDQIASEKPHVWSVSTTGATFRNTYHWDYDGMKLIAGRMIDIISQYYEPKTIKIPGKVAVVN